jgi:K+-transporting ATPase ATPase C chain
MLQHLRAPLVITALMVVVLGLGYPLAITGIVGLLFPDRAGGSLIHDSSGRVIGSALIGQDFVRPQYLHPRPSAAGEGYDPQHASGSNFGPLNPRLIERISTAAAAYRREHDIGLVPADAVTVSASGLDPDISPENARLQAPRMASARRLPLSQVLTVIGEYTRQPTLGFIGQPRVNVLAVNRALDALAMNTKG